MTKPSNERAENLLMRTPASILAVLDEEIKRVAHETGFHHTRQKLILKILRDHFKIAG